MNAEIVGWLIVGSLVFLAVFLRALEARPKPRLVTVRRWFRDVTTGLEKRRARASVRLSGGRRAFLATLRGAPPSELGVSARRRS
jgi:hypothetical protein